MNPMQTRETAELRAACRSCGKESGALFCNSCGKVQPPRETNYFDVFGLPRKLDLDGPDLEKRFYRFSRKLHPDVYARASSEEQQWSLAQTSLLNDAYRTLKDPVERTKYLLKIEGVEIDGGGEEGKKATGSPDPSPSAAPPDLLEEVFELNMQLEEFRMNRKMGEDDPELLAGLSRSKSQFEAQLGSVDEELRCRWSAWDEAWERQDGAKKAAAKESMTVLLYRRSYLNNLLRDVHDTLGDSAGEH